MGMRTCCFCPLPHWDNAQGRKSVLGDKVFRRGRGQPKYAFRPELVRGVDTHKARHTEAGYGSVDMQKDQLLLEIKPKRCKNISKYQDLMIANDKLGRWRTLISES